MSTERPETVGYDLASPIARGRTAEVFDAGPGRILKLYRAGWRSGAAKREYEIALKLNDASAAAPRAFGLEEVSGRRGVVYERVDGHSMMQALLSKPWTFARYARLLAELHFKVNSVRVEGLPSQRERLDGYIRAAHALPMELKEQALRLLESLPGGGALCHGDLHPDNVILSPRGPVIIDWPDAGSGAPLADVARTVVLMKFGALAEPDVVKRTLFRAFGGLFLRSYLGRYMRLSGTDRRELQKWVVVSAAARLETEIPEERQALLQFVARGLVS